MDGARQSPAAVSGVAVALTAVAVVENTVAPWAPFYFGYAALATALPFAFGAVRIARPTRLRAVVLLGAVALGVVLHFAFRLVVSVTDLSAMFGAVFTAASVRLHRPPEVIAARFVLFIQLWAGLGEELFYRGYVQAELRHHLGPSSAIAAASVLFATRHYAQVLVTWPSVPWGSANVWVGATLLVGVALGVLYERTRSLLPPILCHYVLNLLA